MYLSNKNITSFFFPLPIKPIHHPYITSYWFYHSFSFSMSNSLIFILSFNHLIITLIILTYLHTVFEIFVKKKYFDAPWPKHYVLSISVHPSHIRFPFNNICSPEANHSKFICKVKDHKWQAIFNSRLYYIFRSRIISLFTLAGS